MRTDITIELEDDEKEVVKLIDFLWEAQMQANRAGDDKWKHLAYQNDSIYGSCREMISDLLNQLFLNSEVVERLKGEMENNGEKLSTTLNNRAALNHVFGV